MTKYKLFKQLKQTTNTNEIFENIMLDKLLQNLQKIGGINGKSMERIQ